MDNKMKMILHSKPTIRKEEKLAVAKVLESEQISQGKMVVQFEQKMASYIGKKYAIAVSSGLAALHLALLALNIRENDEIILPSYTCDALLNAILYLRAKPKITDVEYNHGNITPQEIKKNITRRTGAVIVPHSLGFPAEIDKIINLGIPVIEDCATSVGAKYKNKKIGSFGLISVFSFYATKMLTTGEGGMLLTNNKKIAKIVRELRDYTGHTKFRLRYNYKMTDIEAATGIVQLKKLDGFIRKRKFLTEKYTNLLKNYPGLILPSYDSNKIQPTFYRYIIKLPGYNINKIRSTMKKRGIFCGKGVLQSLHRLLKLSPKKYPNSERLMKESISLPIYPTLTEKNINFICSKFLKLLKKYEERE